MIPNNCQCSDCLKVWEKFEEQNPCDVCGSEERTPAGYLACECPANKHKEICSECRGATVVRIWRNDVPWIDLCSRCSGGVFPEGWSWERIREVEK